MQELAIPSIVKFGEGIIEELDSLVKDYGSRVLLVTDYNESLERGFLKKIHKQLQESCHGVILYNRLLPLMSATDEIESINWATRQASNARCDLVLSLGRHETLHAAKAIAYLLSNGGNIEDYFLGKQSDKKTISYIEIPTGFGFIPGLVPYFYVSDRYSNSKKIIQGSKNYADLVIVDPKMSCDMNFEQSTSMGLELLALLIDAFTSKKVTPFAEALILQSLEYLFKSLLKAIHDQANITLKHDLCHASILGSLAMAQSSPGVVFALALAMRSLCGVLVSNSAPVILPYVMEFHASAASLAYSKIARLQHDGISEISVVEASVKAIEDVRALLIELDMPAKLSQLQIEASHLMHVVRIASEYSFMHYAPWLFSMDDLHALLVSAL